MMKSTTVLRYSCAPIALAGALIGSMAIMPQAALAQDGTGDAEAVQSEGADAIHDPIVVTARKREERLLDIPESIVALSGEELVRAGVVNVNDLGRQTPSVMLNRRQDNFPNVVIRGIGSFGNVQGVGFYIDEVQNFTDQTMRLEDVQRVEILKGPQGTLYGGSNIGGAIRYISREPTFDFSGKLSAEVGGRDYHNVYGAINAPLSDVFAFRVSGYYTHDDGFVENTTTGNPVQEFREYGARGQLLFEPNGKIRSLTTIRYRNFKGGTNTYSRLDSPNDFDYEADLTFDSKAGRETIALIENLTVDLGGVELTSITSYTHQDQFWNVDADYRVPNVLVASFDDARPYEIYTQELRFSSQNTTGWDWLFGLYGARQDNVMPVPTPVTISVLGNPVPGFYDHTTKQTDLAAFGTVNFYLGDLTIGGGLRVGHTNYKAEIFAFEGVPFDPPLKRSQKDTFLLPKISLSYKLDPDNMIYASVARGAEPGKVSLYLPDPLPYSPEYSMQYEIGIKGQLSNRQLQYELAAYYINYTDRQYENRFFDSNDLLVETISNVGDTRSYGAELGLAFSPDDIPGLELNASLGYLNAEWSEGFLNGQVLDGDDVPTSPEWSGNWAVTYTTPIAGSLELDLHADASYQDKFYRIAGNYNRANLADDRFLVNARIALGSADGAWQIAARIENIFDKRYFYEFTPESAGAAAANGTCVQCHLGSFGARRRGYVSATFAF